MNFHYNIMWIAAARRFGNKRIRAMKRIYSDGTKNEYMGVEKRDREKNLFVIANRVVSMPRVRD